MADPINATPTPTTVSAAPAPIAPPDVQPSAPAVDISGLVQPGASVVAGQPAPSVMGTTEGQGYTQAVANENAAAQEQARIANESTAPPPGKHARLISMIQGLALGLSAAGTSIATHGREGGAAEVTQIQGEEQAQKQAAQAARDAAKNQQIQRQVMIGDTNRQLAQSYLNLMTMPDEITASHLKVQNEQQNLTAGSQALQIQTADFMKQNWGFTPGEITGAQSGQPGAAVDPAHIQIAQSMLTRTVGNPKDPNTTGAVAILGKDNPAVQAALTVASDPKATVQSILAAGQGLNVALQQNSQVTDARKTQADTASAQVKAQQAIGAQNAYLSQRRSPNESFDQWDARVKKTADQALQEGNVGDIGEMMAQGILPPSLALGRSGLSNKGKQDMTTAANNYSLKNFGHPFNVGQAEVQYNYAHSQHTQDTLNLTQAINAPGGSMSTLQRTSQSLPGLHANIANKIFNAGATQFGDPSQAAFHASAISFANEYIQITSGHSATGEEVQGILSQLNAGYSKGQLQGVMKVFQDNIAARQKSIIGNNPYLQNQFGAVSQTAQAVPAPAGSSASKIHQNLTDFTHQFTGKKGTIYSDNGSTWFDANGNLVGGK